MVNNQLSFDYVGQVVTRRFSNMDRYTLAPRIEISKNWLKKTEKISRTLFWKFEASSSAFSNSYEVNESIIFKHLGQVSDVKTPVRVQARHRKFRNCNLESGRKPRFVHCETITEIELIHLVTLNRILDKDPGLLPEKSTKFTSKRMWFGVFP